TSADLDVWMRILDFGHFGFINKNLINYRVAEQSYSYRIAKVRLFKHDIFKVLESENYLSYSNKYSSELTFLLNKDSALRFLNLLRTRDLKKIKEFAWESNFRFFELVKLGFSTF